jgi:hypothetical protein
MPLTIIPRIAGVVASLVIAGLLRYVSAALHFYCRWPVPKFHCFLVYAQGGWEQVLQVMVTPLAGVAFTEHEPGDVPHSRATGLWRQTLLTH